MRLIISLILLIAIGCGTHPVSQTPEQKTQQIRNFFAAILEPEPGPAKPAIPFKQACLDYLEALYFIINNPELVAASGIPQEILDTVPKDFDALKGKPIERILKELLATEDSFFSDNQTKIEEAVMRFKFTLDLLDSIKVPKLGTKWTGFFQKILNNYFPDLVLEDKKRIVAFMIKHLRAENTDTQNLLNWVYASGPYFHKYLQLMADYLEPGNDAKLKALKEGLKDVKSGLPHIHPYYLKTYLQELKSKGIDLGEVADLKSLGAASVGQAFLATNKATGKQIVVKFMRPGIKAIAKREREFFLNQATPGALRESFAEIARQIDEELNYETEVKKIKLGIPAYEGDAYQINVVRPILDAEFPNGTDYFAMEFVDGFTVEQLGKDSLDGGKTFKTLAQKNRDLLTQSILWERVTRKFMWQAMSTQENAFFHGDLHAGNIMAWFDPKLDLGDNPTREQVETAINQGLIKIVLIDFGNAHELTQKQRRSLETIFMSSAKISNSAAGFLNAIYPDRNDLDDVRIKLEQTVFSEENRENLPPKKIGDAMDILLNSDLAIPGYVMAFKRSLAMLMNTYDDLTIQGKVGIHKIGEETYTKNLPNLIEGMGPIMLNSLLNGIVLEGQAAELEGEKIADWLEGDLEAKKHEIKHEWINLRNSCPAPGVDQLSELLDFIEPRILTKLKTKTSDKSDSADKDNSGLPKVDFDYFARKISSGFFWDWEAKQLAFFLGLPADHEDVLAWKQAQESFLDPKTPLNKITAPKISAGIKVFLTLPAQLKARIITTLKEAAELNEWLPSLGVILSHEWLIANIPEWLTSKILAWF